MDSRGWGGLILGIFLEKRDFSGNPSLAARPKRVEGYPRERASPTNASAEWLRIFAEDHSTVMSYAHLVQRRVVPAEDHLSPKTTPVAFGFMRRAKSQANAPHPFKE